MKVYQYYISYVQDHWTNTSTGSHFLEFGWFQIPFPLIFVPKNETNYAIILHTENKSKNERSPKKQKSLQSTNLPKKDVIGVFWEDGQGDEE